MGKKIQTTLILFLCLTNAIAQEYYYWANGHKQLLELSNENQYVIFKSNNRETVAQNLGISLREISNIERLTFSKSIVNRRTSTFGDEAYFIGVLLAANWIKIRLVRQILFILPRLFGLMVTWFDFPTSFM